MIPAYKILKLDTRKLPALIFEPISAKARKKEDLLTELSRLGKILVNLGEILLN